MQEHFVFEPTWYTKRVHKLFIAGKILAAFGVLLIVLSVLSFISIILSSFGFSLLSSGAFFIACGATVCILGVLIGKADMEQEHFSIIQNQENIK